MKLLAWSIVIFFALLASPFMLVGFVGRLMFDGFELGIAIAEALGEWLTYHTED